MRKTTNLQTLLILLMTALLPGCTTRPEDRIALQAANKSLSTANAESDFLIRRLTQYIRSESKNNVDVGLLVVPIAEDIATQSDALTTGIGQLIAEIEQADTNGKALVSEELLGRIEHGRILTTRLDSLRSLVARLMDDRMLYTHVAIEPDSLRSGHSGRYYYEEILSGRPTSMAAMVTLRCVQHSIRSAQISCLQSLYSSIEGNDALWYPKVYFYDSRDTIHRGETSVTGIFVGEPWPWTSYDTYIAGKRIPVKNEKTKWRLPTDTVGSYRIPVTVRMPRRFGGEDTIVETLHYTVIP